MVLMCFFSLLDMLILDVFIGVKTIGLFFKLKIALNGCEDSALNSQGGGTQRPTSLIPVQHQLTS